MVDFTVDESDQLPRQLDTETNYVVACNPPWFRSGGEAKENHEKECDGGEVAFSRRLISGIASFFGLISQTLS